MWLLNVVAKWPRMVCAFSAGGFDAVMIWISSKALMLLPEQNYRCAEKAEYDRIRIVWIYFPFSGIRQTIT
jgi:hypothetical protein